MWQSERPWEQKKLHIHVRWPRVLLINTEANDEDKTNSEARREDKI